MESHTNSKKKNSSTKGFDETQCWKVVKNIIGSILPNWLEFITDEATMMMTKKDRKTP